MLVNNLEKINPNLVDVHNFLQQKKIIFNFRTNTFQGDLQGLIALLQPIKTIFEDKETKILLLELQIQELINLIKKQKEKIVEAYTYFASEKELLKKLINTHLEYRKAPKEGKFKLKKVKEKVYNELAEKVDESLMDEVETILTDCDKLVYWEEELQCQITHNQGLITGKQQVINQITYNIQSINTKQGHVLIGNQTFGNNADFSYQVQELLQTQIEILPK